MPDVIKPQQTQRITTENAAPTQEFKFWLDQISDGNNTITGSGSPEGSITANKNVYYIDTDGVAPFSLYYKSTDGGDTGWLRLS